MIHGLPRGVLARQAEVNEDVARRTLGPRVSSRFALKIPLPVNLDRVESFGVHPRRIKHNVVCRGITRSDVRIKPSKANEWVIPVSYISLMHKLETLGGQHLSMVRRCSEGEF